MIEAKREFYDFFLDQTGHVFNIQLYLEYDFSDIEFTPCFFEKDIKRLEEFCLNNPGYHIMSDQGDDRFNKYIPSLYSYYLADGDPNPDLTCVVCTFIAKEELLKPENSELFAEFKELQRNGGFKSLEQFLPRRFGK